MSEIWPLHCWRKNMKCNGHTLKSRGKNNNRLHPGPSPEFIPISWSDTLNHPWNRMVIQLLAAEFRSNVEHCHYQLLTSLPADTGGEQIVEMIEKKLKRRQSLLKTALRQFSQDSRDRTLPELHEIFIKGNHEKFRKARRNEQRRSVCLPLFGAYPAAKFLDSFISGAMTPSSMQ
jgi:hypothetical protein